MVDGSKSMDAAHARWLETRSTETLREAFKAGWTWRAAAGENDNERPLNWLLRHSAARSGVGWVLSIPTA